MDSQIIEWFHRKRREHGLVCVDNGRMELALHFDLSLHQWDSCMSQLSGASILIGPVECEGEIYFRASMRIAHHPLEILFSLGRPSGPVICWEVRQVVARSVAAIDLRVA